MTIPDGLEKLVNTKLVEKVYEDGFSQPTIEAGNIVTDFVKSLRLFLAPFQLLAAYQDRFSKFLEKVRNKVPDERQIECPPFICGPIIEKLKYLDDSNYLTELYLNLLARAIDKDRINEAHPAFLNIIEQLLPDEAMILYILKVKNINIVDTMDYDQQNNRFYNLKIVKDEFPKEVLSFPDNFDMYITHLESLNLVEWPVYKQDPIFVNGTQTGITRYSKITTKDFGKMFIKACIPEEGFQN